MSLFMFIIMVVYALGGWLHVWDFSGLVMATITVIFFVASFYESISESIAGLVRSYGSDIVYKESNSINSKISAIQENLRDLEEKLVEKLDGIEEIIKNEDNSSQDKVEKTIKDLTEQIVYTAVAEKTETIKAAMARGLKNLKQHLQILQRRLNV